MNLRLVNTLDFGEIIECVEIVVQLHLNSAAGFRTCFSQPEVRFQFVPQTSLSCRCFHGCQHEVVGADVKTGMQIVACYCSRASEYSTLLRQRLEP